ncbi:hypothetical protein [Pararhizobium mangrovi]|uniref:Uncharacterized protein n=1 Tax=Pararhizobium mangrovi TaxID=2590452 RepID=A0A506U3X5_9HYPH|nr:hypothetical protein [Pararhizobium mangrovi]TPW27734.1 hypothetical protein FJU11_10880 [Pararhizobium mangrovi]
MTANSLRKKKGPPLPASPGQHVVGHGSTAFGGAFVAVDASSDIGTVVTMTVVQPAAADCAMTLLR